MPVITAFRQAGAVWAPGLAAAEASTCEGSLADSRPEQLSYNPAIPIAAATTAITRDHPQRAWGARRKGQREVAKALGILATVPNLKPQ